jgi:para-nitrobenzyl esterase
VTARPIVHVGRGSARGAVHDGVVSFLGLPYAAAPTGSARFGPPLPSTWEGERDAGAFGPTAPQSATDLPGGLDLKAVVGPGWVRGGDYLTVNVWTPDPAAAGLPVLVFLHGGAFTGGAARSTGYDGTAFARDGVVLVTLNYRIGAIGFADLAGAPANRGLRDQIAGLEWVREHVAGFGGDPGNVTVFGESAGALSVGALLAAAPEGLFRRAISQSGGASHSLTPAQAAVTASTLAAHLGVPATAEAFADLPDPVLVDGLAQVIRPPLDLRVDGVPDPNMGLSPLGTVIDGDLLHGQPVAAVREGASAGVDLMVGNNADEMNLYLVALPVPSVGEDALRAAVAALHPDPDRVLGAYRAAGRGVDAVELLSAIGTDYMFAVPTARLADAHAPHTGGTWRYEFTWRSPAFGGRLGACHGLELPFVFDGVGRVDYGSLGVADDERNRHLAALTHRAWVSFARDGDPGWPRYTAERPAVRRIGTDWVTTERADGPERAVWDGVR